MEKSPQTKPRRMRRNKKAKRSPSPVYRKKKATRGPRKERKPSRSRSPSEPKKAPTEALPPSELMVYYNNHKNTKKVRGVASFDSSIELYDISMKNRNAEDSYYLADKELQERMRRGNTMVNILDAQQKKVSVVVGRRGLPKFYDLRAPHVRRLVDQVDVPGNGSVPKATTKHQRTVNQEWDTFLPRPLEALTQEGRELTVYLSEKANGENAQVSYVDDPALEQGGFWLVSSKNVGLAFRSAADIESYEETRFDYAKMIARCWLGQLAEVPAGLEAKLKATLGGHTFVGEYCGNQNLQHLVAYSKEEIRFFAVVEKRSVEPCLDIEQARATVEEFGLPFVAMKTYPGVTSKAQFVKLLKELDGEVAAASVEEMGEGSVVYFESKELETGERRVLGICKMKTLEYRFWRKLREKLKQFATGKLTKDKLLAKYSRECLELRNEGKYNTCEPLEHYEAVADKACDVALQCGITVGVLRFHYLHFLNLAKSCFAEKRDPTLLEVESFKKMASILEFNSNGQGPNLGMTSTQLEERKKLLETPVTKIVLVAPALFIDVASLEKYCEEKGFKLAIGLDVELDSEKTLHLANPGRFLNGYKHTKLARVIALNPPDEDVSDLVVDSLVEQYRDIKIHRITNELESKYLKTIYGTNFTKKVVRSRIMKDLAFMDSLEVNTVDLWVSKYTKGIARGNPDFEFNLGLLDSYIESAETLHQDYIAGPWAELDFAQKLEMVPKKAKPSKAEKKRAKAGTKGKIVVLAFYSLSGLGKTHWIKSLVKIAKEKGVETKVISSDDSIREAMDKYYETHKRASRQEAFDACKKKGGEFFKEDAEKALRTAKAGHNTLIVLDKVITPNGVLKSLMHDAPSSFDVRFVAAVPDDAGSFTFGRGRNKSTVPFSLGLITNLCDRAVTRKNHPTVQGTLEKKLLIALSFIKLYANVNNLVKAKVPKDVIDQVVYVPFHKDSTIDDVPEYFEKAVSKALSQIKPFNGDGRECDELADLLEDSEVIRDLKGALGFPTKEEQDEAAEKVLEVFESM